jgi:SnoaL-like domain
MPSRERVQTFIDRIERLEFLEVMPEFYAEDATAQENNDPPRVGLAAMMENERNALVRMKFQKARAASVVVDGDRVAINYVFDFLAGGKRVRMDEIAYQLWRGDKIVSERYFYDPAQRLAEPPARRDEK